MNQMGYATKACFEDALIQEVAPDPLRSTVHVDGPALRVAFSVGVHLSHQRVEHRNLIAMGQESVDEMRADEPGATGDEDVFNQDAASRFL